MSVIIIDGIRLDDETGEILEGVTSDKAQHAAFALAEAQEQVKLWEQNAAIWKAAVIRHQPTKSQEYQSQVNETLTATVVQQENRVLDMDAYREWLTETELAREDLEALVIAVAPGNWRSPFKLDALPPLLRESLEDMVQVRTGEPFVKVTKKRKPAPKVTREEPDLLPVLEASVEAVKGKQA